MSASLAAGVATGIAAQDQPVSSPARTTSQAEVLPVLEARLDSLFERIDGLEPRVVAEREAYEASLRASLPAPVRREVDGLVVRAAPSDIDVAAELFRSTWNEAFAPFFGAPPAELGEIELGLYDLRGEWNPRVGEGMAWDHYVEVGNPATDGRLGARRALMRALLSLGPGSLGEWLGQTSLMTEAQDAAGFDPRTRTLAALRQLAATRSMSNSDCLSGDPVACAVSLGLRPKGWTPEEVVRAWYDQETLVDRLRTQPRFARMRALDPGSRGDAADFYTHVRQRVVVPADASPEEARILVTEGTSLLYDAAPAGAGTRLNLFLYAVERGGDEAVDRWMSLDREMPLEPALESISGLSLDALVSAWRERLTTGDRSENRRLPVRSALSWVALLGILSMTSTRWRLGR